MSLTMARINFLIGMFNLALLIYGWDKLGSSLVFLLTICVVVNFGMAIIDARIYRKARR